MLVGNNIWCSQFHLKNYIIWHWTLKYYHFQYGVDKVKLTKTTSEGVRLMIHPVVGIMIKLVCSTSNKIPTRFYLFSCHWSLQLEVSLINHMTVCICVNVEEWRSFQSETVCSGLQAGLTSMGRSARPPPAHDFFFWRAAKELYGILERPGPKHWGTEQTTDKIGHQG